MDDNLNIKKTTGTYLSAGKEHDLFYCVLTPDTPPLGVIQLCHGEFGMTECYDRFASCFALRGFVVCGTDLRGHGNSSSNEDRGSFDGENLTDDIEELRLIIRRRYRSLPYFMLGQGLGSYIAMSYIVKYPQKLDGVILSGIGSVDRIKSTIFLSGLLMNLRGAAYRSKWLKNRIEKGRNDRFRDENSALSWLTGDAEMRRMYENDPRCDFMYSAFAYNYILKLIRDVSSQDWAPSVPKGLPVLIVAGRDDPLGGYGSAPRQVCDRLQDAEIHELSLKLYSGRHDILNEREYETVYSDIYEWIMDKREGVLACRVPTPLF